MMNCHQNKVNQVIIKKNSSLLDLEERDDIDQDKVNDQVFKNDHNDVHQNHLIYEREVESSNIQVTISNAGLKQSLDTLTFSINRLNETIERFSDIMMSNHGQAWNHELGSEEFGFVEQTAEKTQETPNGLNQWSVDSTHVGSKLKKKRTVTTSSSQLMQVKFCCQDSCTYVELKRDNNMKDHYNRFHEDISYPSVTHFTGHLTMSEFEKMKQSWSGSKYRHQIVQKHRTKSRDRANQKKLMQLSSEEDSLSQCEYDDSNEGPLLIADH